MKPSIETINKALSAYMAGAGYVHGAVAYGLICPGWELGKVWFLAGSGGAWNTQHLPMPPNTSNIFEIASVTKTMTSAIYYLQHGSDDYRGTFGTQVGEAFNPIVANIPILALANYESGFPADNMKNWVHKSWLQDWNSMKDWLSSPTFPDVKGPYIAPPYTCYSYSNLAFGLLGIAAADPANSQPQFVQYQENLQSLAQRLSMSSTDLFIWPQPPDDFAVGYTGYVQTAECLPIDNDYSPVDPMLFGCGGVCSTGDDMMQWLKFNMNQLGSIYGSEMFSLQQGTTYQRPACDLEGESTTGAPGKTYLAWFQSVHSFAPQKTFLWKNGAVKGFSSYLAFENWVGSSPQSSLGVFVLANFRGKCGNAAGCLGKWLLEYICTGIAPPQPQEICGPQDGIGQILSA